MSDKRRPCPHCEGVEMVMQNQRGKIWPTKNGGRVLDADVDALTCPKCQEVLMNGYQLASVEAGLQREPVNPPCETCQRELSVIKTDSGGAFVCPHCNDPAKPTETGENVDG